jgi:TatA/E family protein of Tat protein translocase
MSIGIWQVVLVLLIVLILFGGGKLPKVMGDIAKGLKNFKDGIREGDEEDKKVLTSDACEPAIAECRVEAGRGGDREGAT